MARTEILAAGGIVVRSGRIALIAVVQRRKDDWWVLPKGKLKRNESALAAAKREAVEETGVEVSVQEFLGAVSYEVGGGPKLVQFWRMQVVEGPVRELMDDIKAVEWLPLRAAVERLDHPVERMFLRGVGHRVVVQRAHAPRRERVARDPVVVRKPQATRKKIARTKMAARKRRISQPDAGLRQVTVFADPFEDLQALDMTAMGETVTERPQTESPAEVLRADRSKPDRPNLMQRLMRRIVQRGDDKRPDVLR